MITDYLLLMLFTSSILSFDHQTGVVNNGDGGEVSKEDARQRFLENEIHKTTLKMTEVNNINEDNIYRDGKCSQFLQPYILATRSTKPP